MEQKVGKMPRNRIAAKAPCANAREVTYASSILDGSTTTFLADGCALGLLSSLLLAGAENAVMPDACLGGGPSSPESSRAAKKLEDCVL
jgi:hypothetical protein